MFLWTHTGFGQMDLIQGLNQAGPYQAALVTVFSLSAAVGAGVAFYRRTRNDLVLLGLPVYFTALVFVFNVVNSRYRAPFIPALYLFSCAGFLLPARQQSTSVGGGNHQQRSIATDR